MLRKTILGVLLVLSLVAVPSALAAKHKKHKKHRTHYYLAMGDSLSVGAQPLGPGGAGVETDQGYANDLKAYYAKQVKHLKLVDIGCPGATTRSLLTGHGNSSGQSAYRCDHKGGSQLTAAEMFLKAHHRKGEVALITIDIGANDVDGCLEKSTTAEVQHCATGGESEIQADMPKILGPLRHDAPKGTKFAAMTLYDPFLQFELDSGEKWHERAEMSLDVLQTVNADLTSDFQRYHFKVSNVAGAFQTNDTALESYDGQQEPTNVVNICELTWMCASSPQGPNVHANRAGYKRIAQAYEDIIGKLK